MGNRERPLNKGGWRAIALSILLHGGIVAAAVHGWFTWKHRPPEPTTMAIDATLVDERALKGIAAPPVPAPSPPPPTPVPEPEPEPEPAPVEEQEPPKPDPAEVERKQEEERLEQETRAQDRLEAEKQERLDAQRKEAGKDGKSVV